METNISKKQQEIIDKVLSLDSSLRVTSITRDTKNKNSGHNPNKATAVDFGGSEKSLFKMFELLPTININYTVGLGILKAQKHLHVSDDGRGKRFLELSRPDKNGFVKVVSFGDKQYLSYLNLARKEYGIKESLITSDNSEKKKSSQLNSLAFFVLLPIGFFLFSLKRKKSK